MADRNPLKACRAAPCLRRKAHQPGAFRRTVGPVPLRHRKSFGRHHTEMVDRSPSVLGVAGHHIAVAAVHRRAAGQEPHSSEQVRHSLEQKPHSPAAGVAVELRRIELARHIPGVHHTETAEKLVDRTDNSSTGDFFGPFKTDVRPT